MGFKLVLNLVNDRIGWYPFFELRCFVGCPSQLTVYTIIRTSLVCNLSYKNGQNPYEPTVSGYDLSAVNMYLASGDIYPQKSRCAN